MLSRWRVTASTTHRRSPRLTWESLRTLLRGKPLGRLVTAAEIASTVAWLVSPAASGITGQAIVVAGGEL